MVKKAKAKRMPAKPTKKMKSAQQIINEALKNVGKPSGWKVSENQVGPGMIASYTPVPILTLCGQLEDAILLLENRISNAIAKIYSLM